MDETKIELPEFSDPAETKNTFDQQLVARFRRVINDSLTAHPELRSVVVVFDYHGRLNEADVFKGVWVGADGPVKDFDSVVGSYTNMLSMLKLINGRIDALYNAAVQRFKDLLKSSPGDK